MTCFFFQAEDGIRDTSVTGVQTCALPISPAAAQVKFSYTPVLQSGTTAGGKSIAYPKTDSAEVTALMLDIGPGGDRKSVVRERGQGAAAAGSLQMKHMTRGDRRTYRKWAQ